MAVEPFELKPAMFQLSAGETTTLEVLDVHDINVFKYTTELTLL